MNPCKFIPSRRPATKLRKWLRKTKVPSGAAPLPTRHPRTSCLLRLARPHNVFDAANKCHQYARRKFVLPECRSGTAKESDSALFLPRRYARHACVHATTAHTNTQVTHARASPTRSRPGNIGCAPRGSANKHTKNTNYTYSKHSRSLMRRHF